MKRFLPDVNALLALLDPMHVHPEAAHQWYAAKSPVRLKAIDAAQQAARGRA